MQKTILITGSTDGIGLEAAKTFAKKNHTVLLHGRNSEKLAATEKALRALGGNGHIEGYLADLSKMNDVRAFAKAVIGNHKKLDVLVNNAGAYQAANPIAENGIDIRFLVNSFAPYLLTKQLSPLLNSSSRVVNLSSAAQDPVDLDVMAGDLRLEDLPTYAQSKLALTQWSNHMASQAGAEDPMFVAVNPGSRLGTKMIREAFGIEGQDMKIGADIIVRAALDDEFGGRNGDYYDNDNGQFAEPHPDALDPQIRQKVVSAIERVLADLT